MSAAVAMSLACGEGAPLTPVAVRVSTPTATAAPAATAAPSSCPATAPVVQFVNGGDSCAPFVPAAPGNCGVDSTWWYDCSSFYYAGAVYEYVGGAEAWRPAQGLGSPCFDPAAKYALGDKVKICSTGGAIACDRDHEVNPGMIACCRNHVWAGDPRRVVITATDASGTRLPVIRDAGDPAFSEIVIAHPGQELTVTYCLPPKPLIDAECGTELTAYGSGCTTKTFTPR